MQRNVDAMLSRTHVVPAELPLHDRLSAVGTSLIAESLRPNVVALMRVVIAESPRFPEIACHANNIGYDAGVRRVAQTIAVRDHSAVALERAKVPAARFIDLVFLPHQMRALLGEDLRTLLETAPTRIRQVLAMLSASGALDDWT